jgi:hypothetical protein
MITNPSKPASGEPINQQRRALIGGAMGGALVALLSSPGQVMARERAVPSDPFIVLLKGVYHPVVHAPNLGLTTVNLTDGSYSTTKIYPVFGVAGSGDNGNHEDGAIGNFFFGNLAAYQLPGGTIAMQYLSGGFTPHSDGHGGEFLQGTFEFTILEATGVYRAFKGGHNHMVDKLHKLADGRLDEFCFCVVSTYQFP